MSDKMRWRYGDQKTVQAAVDWETVIETGDLLWLDGDDAKPASDLDTSKLSNSPGEQFAKKFLGVAMQRSRNGDTSPIRVATTGVFEFDCPSSRFELGELIGVFSLRGCGGSNSKYLFNQQVYEVVRRHEAVGRLRAADSQAK